LYVQEPEDARLVFTVMDDSVVGEGTVVGSTSRKLVELIPRVGADLMDAVKQKVLARIKEKGGGGGDEVKESLAQDWSGSLKLTSKPRKKDKNGQIMAAAAAGAMVAGPAGAAVGGVIGSFYEKGPKGVIDVNISYLPIMDNPTERKQYKFKGGMPGLDWGDLYERYINDTTNNNKSELQQHMGGNDFEFCFFVTHDVTGCACAVYRSLEEKRIVISFRGTCELLDLLTDASITQEAWVLGEDVEDDNIMKVHIGFRKSLESISRRLKELILAAVAPGDDISSYDLIVTGHSLGAALATLFTADVGEYGIDAGRGLPQLAPSEPWFLQLTSTFTKGKSNVDNNAPPPRPKTLRMYNFGSPRVGNDAFVDKFESLVGGGEDGSHGIDEVYRIVNGEDVVARLPRTVNALGLVSVGYEHCGPTVLISTPEEAGGADGSVEPLIWIEGLSDGDCSVRDGTSLTSPLAKGSLLGDIISAVREAEGDSSKSSKDGKDDNGKSPNAKDTGANLLTALKGRFNSFSATDLTSIVGLDKKFVERESKIVQSIFSGEAVGHHMEDQYYIGMGRACELEEGEVGV